ncbi:hypothetical protein VUR80DRAFT_2453 [Thermomyces stellatus]
MEWWLPALVWGAPMKGAGTYPPSSAASAYSQPRGEIQLWRGFSVMTMTVKKSRIQVSAFPLIGQFISRLTESRILLTRPSLTSYLHPWFLTPHPVLSRPDHSRSVNLSTTFRHRESYRMSIHPLLSDRASKARGRSLKPNIKAENPPIAAAEIHYHVVRILPREQQRDQNQLRYHLAPASRFLIPTSPEKHGRITPAITHVPPDEPRHADAVWTHFIRGVIRRMVTQDSRLRHPSGGRCHARESRLGSLRRAAATRDKW